jgi:ribosomal protein S18 acetylase RimI-like enzyme
MTKNIRPMKATHKKAVMNILQATSEFKPIEVITAEELIDYYLTEGTLSGYHVLIAKVGTEINGYICFGPIPLTDGTWDVYWMAVSPEKKGQGIGSALLAMAEGKIHELNGRLILIETSSTAEYELTRRFYHHAGYNIICRIPDFYAVGDGLVVFQKRLV